MHIGGVSKTLHDRQLRLESLEERRLLAGVTVSNTSDIVNGNATSIVALIADNGGDGISLREAIRAANNTPGADVVSFAAALGGQVISLIPDIDILEALTLDAAPLAQNVIVQAFNTPPVIPHRIFNITATSGNFTFTGLTLRNGRLDDDSQSGAAIRSATSGLLTLHQSILSGNATTATVGGNGGAIYAIGPVRLTETVVANNSVHGISAKGGAIFSHSDVTLIDSSVTGNVAEGLNGRGGGIYAGRTISLTRSYVGSNATKGLNATGGGIYAKLGGVVQQSTISKNYTEGFGADGGGVFSGGAMTFTESTVDGNRTSGETSRGGGLFIATGALIFQRSTLSGNKTTGMQSTGGGIYAAGTVLLTNSTVSGNFTTGASSHGGGIRATNEVTVTGSTVTNNFTQAASAQGGGLSQANAPSNAPIRLNSSIVAGNTAAGGGPDIARDPGPALMADYSLLGTTVAPTSGGNNVPTNAPMLGPLTDNGGPTQTHTLLAGSPAINAGDPALNPSTDQRGFPFAGKVGARADIGSVERQTLQPSWFVVTTTADVVDYLDGNVSLREAVTLANGSAGPETITFASGLSGATITLTAGEMVIKGEDLTIDARALPSRVTINANQASRIFNFTPTTGNFTLGGLTLTGGRTVGNNASVADTTFSGGAIRSLSTGALSLQQTTVTNSRTTGTRARGGAIFAIGNVSVVQSAVTANSTSGSDAHGGGIFSVGSVSLNRSSVSGNGTTGANASGGGFYARGNTSINLSTVSGNTTTQDDARGGGLWAYGNAFLFRSTISGNSTAGPGAQGGGMFIDGPTSITYIELSTISGNRTFSTNSAGGGVFARNITLSQSTVTDNRADISSGGGLLSLGTTLGTPLTISGSILSANTAGGGSADLSSSGSALHVVYSLIGTGVVPTTGGNNVPSNAPQIAALADNGGVVKTHALLATSPAIDAGDPAIAFSSTQFDGRGTPFVRVFDGNSVPGARIDIGAFERQTLSDANLNVSHAIDENDGDYSPGELSLREAIILANLIPGPNTVTFAASMSGTHIVLTGSEMGIAEALTIDARPLAANVTFHANNLSRVFNITATTGDFTIAGLTLTGGRTFADLSAGEGGAIRSASNGTLSILDSTISNHATTGVSARGGAIRASGPMVISGSTISGNSTAGSNATGGGIAVSFNGTVSIVDSTISGNSTQGVGASGGGLYSLRAVSISNSTISGNSTAAASGGGVYTFFGLTVENSTVTNNSVTGANGGGLYSYSGPVTIRNSIVAGNQDVTDGSHPDLKRAGTFTLQHSLIGDNNGTSLAPAPVGSPDSNGNIIGSHAAPINPLLGALADNGGPTRTHALLAGSPAIDRGDPAVAFNPAAFDQRGAPNVRVVDGDGAGGARLDMGAFELQPVTPTADFDSDLDVDGVDFLAWQRGFGLTGAAATRAQGNADGDADVDATDLAQWRTTFGAAATAPSQVEAAEAAVQHAMIADAVFSSDLTTGVFRFASNRRRLARR